MRDTDKSYTLRPVHWIHLIPFIYPSYLPKLWDDTRQIIVENNDFFSINPAAVDPATTNQQSGESSL